MSVPSSIKNKVLPEASRNFNSPQKTARPAETRSGSSFVAKPGPDPVLEFGADEKKPPGFAAGGFFAQRPGGAAGKRINASRTALRDVLCADQLFYARLHVHRG
jgi:hypothetical protein